MSIKTSTTISIGIFSIVFLALVLLLTNVIITNSFRDLEKQEALKKLESFRNRLDNEHQALEVIVRDWAHWDDMRNFVLNRNKRFIGSNFSAEIFENYRIHISTIMDKDFSPILALGYDFEDEELRDISPIVSRSISKLIPHLKLLKQEDAASIMVKTNSGPICLSFLPILDSSGNGPIQGYFMMGRYMNTQYLEDLGSTDKYRIKAIDLTKTLNSNIDYRVSQSKQGNNVKFLDQNRISATDVISDINNDDLYLIEIEAAMEATSIGKHMRNMMIGLLIIFALLQVFLTRIILKRVILGRVLTLQKEISRIAHEPISKAFVPESGDDELTDLAKYINAALIEIRKTQAELEKAKTQAEESDQMKSSFLSTITHELRTPLNHIMGFSQLISSQAINPEVKGYASQIYNSGDVLLKLIQDIIHLAFADQALLQVNPQEVQFFDHFFRNKSSLEDLLKRSGKEKSISLIFNPDQSRLLTHITIDDTKVNQILHKLFLNAVKYTSSGRIEFGMHPLDENTMRYYVKDTGIGIAENKQDIIFSYFRQSDEGSARAYSGIGIGLSIAKRICEVLSASLRVESTLGQGSTFYLDVPCKMREATPERISAIISLEPPKLNQASFLVVDSDETSLMIIKSLIHKTGAHVLPAATCEMAMHILDRNDQFTALILSFDLCEYKLEALSAYCKDREIKIPIILTGTGFEEHPELKRYDMLYCIHKPILRSEFYNLLTTAIPEIED